MQRGDGPLVTSIGPNGFRIGDGVLPSALLTPERAAPWNHPPLATLDVSALSPLLALNPPPEFIIIGSGTRFARPPMELVRALDALGVGVEAMDSRAAARAWGVLRAEGRWIAAALYPLD